jgi:DNA-binding beta-propeller fold protein YncE
MRTLLKSLVLALALASLSGCPSEGTGAAPPLDSFHYPVSVSVLDAGPAGPRVLYVVSSNFDLRYNRGTVLAIDLNKLGDRVDGPVGDAIDPEHGYVLIDSFAGLAAQYQPVGAAAEARTLFVPTRANNLLYVVDASGAQLSCRGTGGQDCLAQGISLEQGNQIAQDPFATAISGHDLYVTHLRRPTIGEDSVDSVVVRMDAESPGTPTFFSIGPAPSEGITATPAGLYFTGRALRDSLQPLRRLSDSTVSDAGIESSTRIKETRGIAVSSDGTRLYVATRGTRTETYSELLPAEGPDGLLIVDISADPLTGEPRNQPLGFVSMPEGASRIHVMARPGAGDLVAVACTDSNMVALYDADLGEVVGLVQGTVEPFDIASIALGASGRRLYVASFGNHTVDVIDIPDMARPGEAKLVGKLGGQAQQTASALLPEDTK